jgi:hypothetical protein
MAIARGIFGIIDVVDEKFSNRWTNLSDVWIDQSSNTGYFAGGEPNDNIPGKTSQTDKVSYSTNTTSISPNSNLSISRDVHAATSSTTAGYFSGGGNAIIGITQTITDKLTYLTDTTIAVPGANLITGRYNLTATGSSAAAYFSGGNANPGVRTTSEKITYSSDTTAGAPTANLSVARMRLGSTGSSTAGYFGGGESAAFPTVAYSTMDKLTFATDTTVFTPGANLLNNVYYVDATGSLTAGYFGGGQNGSSLNKLTYSSDTTALAPSGANLIYSFANTTFGLAATGSSTVGYFGGGRIAAVPTPLRISTMSVITYSTETTLLSPSSALTASRAYLAAASSKENALLLWRRFSDGSTTSNPASIPQATPTPQTAIGVLSQPNTGYFGGGGTPAPFLYSRMDKLTYVTDTTTYTPSANLVSSRYRHAATGNVTTGYFGGGTTPGPTVVSSMDKVTYATDTTTNAPTGANLNSVVRSLAATGNPTAGYFGGGFIPLPGPGGVATMNKITYSTDIRTTLPGTGSLSSSRYNFTATGNTTAGYFGGGSVPSPAQVTTMDKLTYSTDTRSTVPGASLSVGRNSAAATGNSTAGYFGGGFSFPTNFSTMDKVTYASDTRSTIPGASLSTARSNFAATGNSTAGYFGGGNPGTFSRMDKITYSTDTTVFTPTANLSVGRDNLAASSATANALTDIGIGPVLL